MSEKEKEIIKRISNSLPKLNKDEQNYILGVAEGMAVVRESYDIQKQEAEEKVS